MKEWTTPDSRNTPSTTNLEEEEIVDAPGNDGNASMPEHVKRPNAWRKMMMMMIFNMHVLYQGHKTAEKSSKFAFVLISNKATTKKERERILRKC